MRHEIPWPCWKLPNENHWQKLSQSLGWCHEFDDRGFPFSKAEDGCHCVTSISQLGNCCLYLGPEGVSFSISFPEILGMKISLRVVDSSQSRKGSSLIRARARYRDSSHAAESLPKLALDLITCRPLLGKKIRIPSSPSASFSYSVHGNGIVWLP